MFNNKLKYSSLALYLSLGISISVPVLANANDTNGYSPDVSAVECTDEEVALYLDKEGIADRHKMNRMSKNEFRRAYLSTRLVEAEQSGSVGECLAAFGDNYMQELEELQEKLMKGIDDLNDLMQGGIDVNKLFDRIWSKIQDKLSEKLCSVAKDSSEVLDESWKNTVNSAKDKYYDVLEQEGLDIFTSQDLMDRFLTNETRKEINDEAGLLKWKDGRIDEEYFKNQLHNSSDAKKEEAWEKEVEKMFGEN